MFCEENYEADMFDKILEVAYGFIVRYQKANDNFGYRVGINFWNFGSRVLL